MSAIRAELLPHPTTPCAAVRRIAAEIEPAGAGAELAIRYRVEGDIGRLRLPLAGTARRRDELWQHSCFEAFLQPDANDSYHEFNFAPSGDWAAYRFRARRSEWVFPAMPAPRIAFRQLADACELSASVPLAALSELAGAATLLAGITAVIEADDGRLSYWALAHGGPTPDFHDPATFTLRLPSR